MGKTGSLPLTDILIPGLPNDLALNILARLPRALHPNLRRICCAWRNALQPLAMSALRNTLHISEIWTLFLFQNNSIAFYDPLLQHLISSPRTLFSLDTAHCFLQVLGAVSSEVFFLRRQIGSADIRCLDAVSMQWQSNSIPLWSNNVSSFCFASAVVDGHLWVVGGGEDGREVGRFDVKSRVWETMPNMHEWHFGAVAVVLQGRLHVIGGGKTYDDRQSGGEIYDPRTGEWILEPALWPAQLGYWPVVAVVKDTLYALRGETIFCDNNDELELFHYVSESKQWASLGHLALEEYACSCGGLTHSRQLVGAGKELWVVFSCSKAKRTCTSKILSCVPRMGPSPLSWRRVPITSNVKIRLGCVRGVLSNVHI